MKTIDCTPTWEEMLPMILRLMNSDKSKSREIAQGELGRMAKVADLYNKLVKAGEI